MKNTLSLLAPHWLDVGDLGRSPFPLSGFLGVVLFARPECLSLNLVIARRPGACGTTYALWVDAENGARSRPFNAAKA